MAALTTTQPGNASTNTSSNPPTNTVDPNVTNPPAVLTPITYETFVEQEMKYWTDNGITYNNNNDDDNKTNNNNVKYSNKMIEDFIMNVYKQRTVLTSCTSFTELLLLFTHQMVIGRIFASYAQIPELLRKKLVINKIFTTLQLLNLQWNEKSVNNDIPVDFRRVYLIYLTNYLNRMWQFYHVNLDQNVNSNVINSDSPEYIHIVNIQNSLNNIINSTALSTTKKEKLSSTIVFEKIAENCCNIVGAVIDSLIYKYNPINISSLQELYNIFSLISLRINELYRNIEEKWIKNVDAKKNEHFKNKSGNENFVTLVIKSVSDDDIMKK